jgi:hypothetical protein
MFYNGRLLFRIECTPVGSGWGFHIENVTHQLNHVRDFRTQFPEEQMYAILESNKSTPEYKILYQLAPKGTTELNVLMSVEDHFEMQEWKLAMMGEA